MGAINPPSPFIFGASGAQNLENNILIGYTTTATAAGTTALTATSTYQQFFTGTTTQTVTLPVVSGLVLGQQYVIVNNSTGAVSVQSSGANAIITIAANSGAILTCVLVTGTTAASWNATVLGAGGAVTPTVQKFTSSTGTYTTPANVSYIRVRMVGGGGGGAGSGTTGAGNGGTGGNSTFSVLTANGGVGAVSESGNGAIGGSASLGSGPIGTVANGNSGGGSNQVTISSGSDIFAGGIGGAGFFGGAGVPQAATTGGSAVANSGGGGAGAGTAVSASIQGGGGGAGGFVDAIIASPAATYSYGVGAAGTAGTAGTSGFTGGAGGSGYIEVTEYYNNGAIGTATNVTGIVAKVNGGTGTTGPVTFSVNTSTTAGSATIPLVFTNVTNDSSSGYNVSTGRYTVPAGQGGMWFFSWIGYFGSTIADANLYQNGVQIVQGTTATTSTVSHGAMAIQVSAGDIIDIRPSASATASGGSTQTAFSGFAIH